MLLIENEFGWIEIMKNACPAWSAPSTGARSIPIYKSGINDIYFCPDTVNRVIQMKATAMPMGWRVIMDIEYIRDRRRPYCGRR
jgi:hypothetical protein